MLNPTVKVVVLWTFFMFTDKPDPVQVRGAPTFFTLEACTAELARREVLGAFCDVKGGGIGFRFEWEDKP